MESEEYRKLILNGEICPYCNSNTKVLTEQEVYGRDFRGRKIHTCINYPQCDSYVGSHNDGTALGRLANKELREWKEITHKHFDLIWKEELASRDECYLELSEYLKIDRNETHIGMFDVSQCRVTIRWANQLYNNLKTKIE